MATYIYGNYIYSPTSDDVGCFECTIYPMDCVPSMGLVGLTNNEANVDRDVCLTYGVKELI